VRRTITINIKPKEPMTCVMGPMDGRTVNIMGNADFFRVPQHHAETEGFVYHRYKRIGNVLYYLGVEAAS